MQITHGLRDNESLMELRQEKKMSCRFLEGFGKNAIVGYLAKNECIHIERGAARLSGCCMQFQPLKVKMG